MSKFVSNLVKDSKGIKQQRAEILAEETKNEQDDLVREITKRKRDLEIKLLNLTDLSPDNTYSLKPGGEGFNPKSWVREIQNTKIELLNIAVELKAANETTAEWFGDE